MLAQKSKYTISMWNLQITSVQVNNKPLCVGHLRELNHGSFEVNDQQIFWYRQSFMHYMYCASITAI